LGDHGDTFIREKNIVFVAEQADAIEISKGALLNGRRNTVVFGVEFIVLFTFYAFQCFDIDGLAVQWYLLAFV